MQKPAGILSSEVAASCLDEMQKMSTLPTVRGVKARSAYSAKTELFSTIGLSLYLGLSSTSQQVIAEKVFKRKKKKANRK